MRGTNKPFVSKLGVRTVLVRLWAENPAMTCEQAYVRTGASKSVVQKVRRDLVERGALKAPAKKEGCP